MKVVVAADKFKGSLTAREVADALRAGVSRTAPTARVVRVPVADGGDGTLEAALSAGFERRPVTVAGPTGDPVDTAYARRGDTAVVELADASGLLRLPGPPAPWAADTSGTGQVLATAIEDGCRQVVLGVGGSCSTDGGAGLVTALGAQLLDADGEPIAPGATGLRAVHRLDLTALRTRLAGVSVVLACDVDNPLLGPGGAAAVYGPQKGAGPDDVPLLETALAGWADLVARVTGRDLRDAPGAGAAGGAGFAALALLGAELCSGVRTVLDLVGFDDVVRSADLVVTGEGSLDEQSLRGKAPIGVVTAATRLGIPVVGVCGRTTLDAATLAEAGFRRVWSLADHEPDPAVSMRDAARLLTAVGADLGHHLHQLAPTR
ncbi:glycerate kinase [Nocardioides marinus]|nr:glycerate kinase [Nocardioides marinus]